MDGRIKPVKPLANRVVEKVMVKLDGREWQLIINHNVLCELESMTGVNALFGADNVFTRPSAKTLRALLFLCLREQGADYTLDEVGNLINARTLPLITKGILLAWVASMPKKEDVEAEMGEGEIRAAV